MTSEVTHGKRTDAVANHARILEAARSVLIERGLDMEVNEVADRAGVGVGTLYRHFANRDDLVRAVLAQTCDDIICRLRAAVEIEDSRAALRQIPRTLIIDQSLYAIMQDPRSAKFLRPVKQFTQSMALEILGLVASLVQRGMQDGSFRADLDPPITAASILGSIGVTFELLGPTRPLSELADLIADLHSTMVTAS